jgi:hypothetical protein
MSVKNVGAYESLLGVNPTHNQQTKSGGKQHSTQSKGNASSETVFSPAATIAKEYDPRDITPRQIMQMAEDLLNNGLVSFDQYAFLSFRPRLSASHEELISAYTGLKSDPDRSIDLVSELESVLQTQRQANAGEATLSRTEAVLQLVQGLDYMHDVIGA